MKNKPRIIFTTDVNGTTTPDNTFAELVRPDGFHDRMVELMKRYTNGACSFSDVLPEMKNLTCNVTRHRLDAYARQIPFFHGVEKALDILTDPRCFDAMVALSTTGFAGLMALVNKIRHGSRLKVAASPVLLDLLEDSEQKCLIGTITEENDKVKVIDSLIKTHVPEPGMIFHAGDTLGDFPALVHVAKNGGTGIAFCPNEALKNRIQALGSRLQKHIQVVDPNPDNGPDYLKVLNIIKGKCGLKIT